GPRGRGIARPQGRPAPGSPPRSPAPEVARPRGRPRPQGHPAAGSPPRASRSSGNSRSSGSSRSSAGSHSRGSAGPHLSFKRERTHRIVDGSKSALPLERAHRDARGERSCAGLSETPAGRHEEAPHLTLCRSRSEEHTSELQSRFDLVCRLLLEKTKACFKRKTLSREYRAGWCGSSETCMLCHVVSPGCCGRCHGPVALVCCDTWFRAGHHAAQM